MTAAPWRMATTRAPWSRHHWSSSTSRVRIRRVQVRNSEDAVLVGEAPLVFDPAVERAAHLDGRLDVGRQHRRLEHDALRREQPRGLDALRVHDLQALVTLVPLGVLRRRLVERRQELLSGELPREVVHERSRLRPRVHVGGAGQHREDLAVEDVPQHAVDFLHLHPALGELRIAEPGERVARLPVVVVGVEDRRDLVGGVRHGSLSVRAVPEQLARCGVGALAVDERRRAVDDDPVVTNGLLDQAPLPRRVVVRRAPGEARRPCRGRRRSRRRPCPRSSAPRSFRPTAMAG